jgi:hypothetical protein
MVKSLGGWRTNRVLTRPPKAFIDTQIIIDVGRGVIPPELWSKAAQYLRTATEYCISPLTAGELICGLEQSGEEHFEKHREQLRALIAPNREAEVFDFIPYFIGSQLGIDVERPANLEDDFLGSIGLILDAPSKASLLSGYRHPSHPGQTVRVRIDRLAREHSQTLQAYFGFMEHRRKALAEKWRGPGAFRVEPEGWASFILNSYSIAGSAFDSASIATRLSAAYEFEMSLNILIRDRGFSVEKNRGDLVDGQQLFYLFDPIVVFITNDNRIKRRTAASAQSTRIITFRDLVRCAETCAPLV